MVQLIIVVKTRFFPSVVRSELVEQVNCAFSQLRGVDRSEAFFQWVVNAWLIFTSGIRICVMCLLVFVCVYIYRNHCFGYTTPMTMKK